MDMSAKTRMRENIFAIRERIACAAARSGRRAEDIALVGVSKFQPLESLYMALDCGITVLGENRVQEREQKAASWSVLTPRKVEWHMIGHLQRNKARKAAELFDCIESVDSAELAFALDRIIMGTAEDLKVSLYPVMIEVNTSGEESKNGVWPDRAIWLIEEITRVCPRLTIEGLMTIGPIGGGARGARESFSLLRSLIIEARGKVGLSIPHLSMGMSGDFEIAIEEGSTLVRIGTGIFGARHG
ncbi:MAG: YggS family pyridoxal phosphate-dependent enzyme [Synergistaceae bacterium]|jgi:pyridoxal phosphate enzyme (YggS family)|nr:YggS family pyridoxal phosphate-dependent enzyme [Synergistaceae bacterium]